MPLSTPTDLGEPLATGLSRAGDFRLDLARTPQIDARLKAPGYLTLDDGTSPVRLRCIADRIAPRPGVR